MVEVAVAAESIPPDWFEDDRLLLTVLDVLNARAEAVKKSQGRKGRR